MEVTVDDIAAVLNAADINSILSQYYKDGKGEDPIIHFYETFLNQYDPQTRERRGVYYTPEPVVKYIVKSVHSLLKTHFNLPDGLADPSVTLLDPAAGTMAFPSEAVKVAVQEYVQKYGDGGKKEFIRNQILRNFYAFELMMAPYAIDHMKISLLLDSFDYQMGDDERFKLYLTNTLEMDEIEQIAIPGVGSLSEESFLAGQVKKKESILVIMGNPPYSGSSANKNEWTEKLLKEDLDGAQSYYKVDGKPLGERNPKWLQNDYVKFLRFAQWKIQKAGKGIVAMITSHSYLNNPTFRGMRQSLIRTFDDIFILDLHGNINQRETTPEGGRDENVFDIKEGVSIIILLKHNKKGCDEIHHYDLFGSRENKYSWLLENEFLPSIYNKIDSANPYYLFVPSDIKKISHYLDWLKLTEIFPVNSVGIVTSRDDFVIDSNRNALENRFRIFSDTSQSDEHMSITFDLKDSSIWKLSQARREISKEDDLSPYIKEILYRPFDKRFIFYHKSVIERMRQDVMQHMLENNLGLISVRQVAEGVFNHCFVTENLVESRITVSNKGIGYLFPLYLYRNNNDVNLFSQIEPKKTTNFSDKFTSLLAAAYSFTPKPEDVFSYVYGILYSPSYRSTYAPFLKYDFPRIPFTSDYQLFKLISSFGQRLIDIDLLKSAELDQPSVKFQGKGDDHTIYRLKYSEKEQRLYINPSYYFDGLTPEIWNYQLCGYQVLDKYLKERKGRQMDDPRHFIRVAAALAKTIEIQAEIDELYPEVEKDVIEF